MDNTTGTGNTAVGSGALESNTAASNNTALGYLSLNANVSGASNVAIGSNVLDVNTSGSFNAAVGVSAMTANTTGGLNCAFGYAALSSNSTGGANSAFGYDALLYNTATGNSAFGYYSLLSNSSGTYNTAVGYSALDANTTGTHNTALGYNAFGTGTAYTNSTAIGNGATVGASNIMVLGNSSIATLYCQQTSITTISDGRVKENVQQDVPGLDFITKLRPVSYNLNIHKQNALSGNEDSIDWEGKYDIEKMRFNGLIAQEVDSVMEATGAKFTGLDKPTETDNLYHMRYGDLIIPMVKAMQEQKQISDQQKEVINAQELKIQELMKRLEQLEALNNTPKK
jgi:hypothetical protein